MGISSKSSNVLLAKCRAKFGRRLTSQDIRAIASCHSVAEVASYLKSNTNYADALSGIDEKSAHRHSLENALVRKLYDDLSSLCRYEMSVGDWFGDYIMLQSEIEQLMSFLSLLSAGRPGDFIFTLPDFFAQHSQYDFRALSRCRSYADMLAVMRQSRFIKILRAFVPLDGQPIDCAAVEHALYAQFYKTMYDIIDKHYHGKARHELEDFIGTQLDLRNFAHIYRLKKYYGADNDTIRTMLFDNAHHTRIGITRDMVEAPDAETALEIFAMHTPYGRRLDREIMARGGIETATERVMYNKALRLLRGSVNPT
ncbi:MAG: V-type ATPase subunit, partial [Clostridia bacterium]|nr:V-type ATPase subunit [Clostridia bacterium]